MSEPSPSEPSPSDALAGNQYSRIVTLTLNPALDLSFHVDNVVPTHKLRARRPTYQPGGGGINVSRVCRRLDAETIAVVPLGGPSGRRMADLLVDELDNDEVRIIPIQGDTRESIAVVSDGSGEQYRFVLPGSELSTDEVSAAVDATIGAADPSVCRCVTVSGSVPSGVDLSFFSELVQRLPHVSVVIDTSGPALMAALNSGAFLVKPSARELASVVDRELSTEIDIMHAAREVKAGHDISVLVVSVGPGGAFVVTDDETRRLRAPTVKVRSAVGAGDSMVAGIATGLQRGLDLDDAVALGVAAGTAAVLTDGSDLCDPTQVEALLGAVQ